MDIPKLLEKLSLDAWYKVLILIGFTLFVISLLFEIHGITNKQLLLLSGGLFLIGLGEWKNHKIITGIKPPNAYTGPAAIISQTKWLPDVIGVIMDLIGILMLVLFICSIL